MEIALVIESVLLLLMLYFWRSDRWAWEAERKDLLNRLMARNLGEYQMARQSEEIRAPKASSLPNQGKESDELSVKEQPTFEDDEYRALYGNVESGIAVNL